MREGKGSILSFQGVHFSQQGIEPGKIGLQGLFGVHLVLMIKNADGSVISTIQNDLEHCPFMFSFAQFKNLGLSSCIHAIEVQAVQVG